jgi:hypothetical protein
MERPSDRRVEPQEFYSLTREPAWRALEQYLRQRKTIIEQNFRALGPEGTKDLAVVGALAWATNCQLAELDFLLSLRAQAEKPLTPVQQEEGAPTP